MEKKNKDIKCGTILVYSIGFGCDHFWQVVKVNPKSVVVRKIEDKAINVNVKRQTCDYIPVKDKFRPPHMGHRYLGGYKEGNPRFKDIDENIKLLKISSDGKIGPTKRLMWWTVWTGKPLNQWSP